jgi:DNA-binding CsgD family transcriptional regulator
MSAALAWPGEPSLAPPPSPSLREHALAACKDRSAGSANLGALWRALVEGRFRFVECFEQNGCRYFVLHENLDAGPDARLTSRERNLVEEVGRGGSEKCVAFALGVTPSVASALLKSALLKLGLRSKVDLVVLVGALRQRAANQPSATSAERAGLGPGPQTNHSTKPQNEQAAGS